MNKKSKKSVTEVVKEKSNKKVIKESEYQEDNTLTCRINLRYI